MLPISRTPSCSLVRFSKCFRLSSPRLTSQCLQSSTSQHKHDAQSFSSKSTSINEDEIAHFSRLSAHWWDDRPGSEFALLHQMNPARVSFIKDKVLESETSQVNDAGEEWTFETRNQPRRTRRENTSTPLTGLNILDIGCGGGLLSSALSRLGARTLGIDASPQNIKIASAHASQDPHLSEAERLTYRHVSAERLVEEDRRFDAVCALEVLEHVDQPAEFLRTCANLVKPGGHLFLSTISRTPIAYLLTIFAAEQMLRLVTPGTHTYSKYVKPEELIEFFSKPLCPSSNSAIEKPAWISHTYAGQPKRTEAEVRGIVYVPWAATWRIAPRGAAFSTDCNYMFWVRKPVNSEII